MRKEDNIATSADGVPIHYDISGGGQTALVFIHGWCCSRRFWDRQLPFFSRQHTVVTIDLAGHGSSGTGRKHWTMPAFGLDVAAVVKHLDLEQVVLIGHSMGGYVIIEAGQRLEEALIGLVGVDTWRDIGSPRTSDQIEGMLSPLRRDFVSAARAFAQSMFLPTSDPELVENTVSGMSAMPPNIAISAFDEALNYADASSKLSEIVSPKGVIYSEHWGEMDLEMARSHGIEPVPMRNVGHFVMLEDPNTFNNLLDRLVRRF